MKRAFILFWQGLTGLLAGIAEWFTVILGMKDESKYGRFMRRVVGTCFAVVMVVFALAAVVSAGEALRDKYGWRFSSGDDEEERYAVPVSRGVTYYPATKPGKKGYLMTMDGHKTIGDIVWMAKPLGHDSLCCYSDGAKRGYFSKYTGEPVIEPKYGHAWVFSEGLAAVEEGGRIKFIDQTGKVVIDNGLEYDKDAEGYVFHYGYCVASEVGSRKYGLIDRQGDWAVKAGYDEITPVDSMWLMRAGGKEGVMKAVDMSFLIPMADVEIKCGHDCFYVKGRDNVVAMYGRDGKIIDDSHVYRVKPLFYETNELAYNTRKTYDENGDVLTSETDYENPTNLMSAADRNAYENGFGDYGLISEDGKIITPPLYKNIQALARGVYMCEDAGGFGILVDNDGKRIKN